MQNQNMFIGILRTILGAIDTAVYFIVEIAFQILFDLANTDLLGGVTFENFSSRIYLIIGLFMLFKLAFSFLNSVVNPDNLMDKEKGIGKLVTRILIAMIMLVMVPTAFTLAKEAQALLIPVIPRLIIGVGNGNSDSGLGTEVNAKVGQQIAFETYRVFFTYDKTCYDESQPEGDKSIGSDFKTVAGALGHINDICTTPGNGSVYKYDYMPIIPLLAGGFLAFILIGFCIDVAIRVFKLTILQLFAPIPIISYIDPKSEKDGAFSGWLKNCISTYLSLFITLSIVYFTIFIINEVLRNGVFRENLITKFGGGLSGISRAGFVVLFLILGLFFFAKKAPKFIMDILGVKGGDGGFLGKFAKASGKFAHNTYNKTAGAGLNSVAGMAGGAFAGLRSGGFDGMKQGAKMGGRMGLKNGWDGKGGSFLSAGDKMVQMATGDSSAKMGALGGARFIDKMNSNQNMKNIKSKFTGAVDSKNQKILDNLDMKENERENYALDEHTRILNAGMSKEDTINALNKLYKSSAMKKVKYSARRADIDSVKQNRNDSKRNADQAKIWAQAIKDAQKGGGPAPGAPDKKE
ncbi:MAG: hypothetical protein RSB99_02695 [Bacilli bacterium]